MKIKKQKVNHRIYLLKFKSSKDASTALLRFEEFYESPKFRGRVFSHEEFKKWYKEVHGAFTYSEDWGAYNFPSSVLRPFFKGKFNPLTRAERKVLDELRDIKGKFYVVGVSEKARKEDVRHELAHALFSTVAPYKKKVNKVLRKFDISSLKYELSQKNGYSKNVLLDEVHAWVIGSPDEFSSRVPTRLKRSLRGIFREFAHEHLYGVSY